MDETPPVIMENVNHWFGFGEAKKQALFDINLTIEKGGLTVLMGPSGSGKTTVLTLMGCLREVQEGRAELLGWDLKAAGNAERNLIRRHIGFIFQAHNLHESLTARQNVMMGLEVHGRGSSETRKAAVEHILDLVGLSDRIDYLPANLSGGQKQRVAVARALVSNPKVIFADEPTAALDKESGRQVVEMLKSLGNARGTTTVMVTHDNRILDLADRIVTLEDGRVVKDVLTK